MQTAIAPNIVQVSSSTLAQADVLPPLSLQAAEVGGYRWIPVDEIQPAALRRRLVT